MTQGHWSNRSIRQAFEGNLPAKGHPSRELDARDAAITNRHPKMSRNAVDQIKNKTNYEMNKRTHPKQVLQPRPGNRGFSHNSMQKLENKAAIERTKQLDMKFAAEEANKHKTQGKSR